MVIHFNIAVNNFHTKGRHVTGDNCLQYSLWPYLFVEALLFILSTWQGPPPQSLDTLANTPVICHVMKSNSRALDIAETRNFPIWQLSEYYHYFILFFCYIMTFIFLLLLRNVLQSRFVILTMFLPFHSIYPPKSLPYNRTSNPEFVIFFII